MGEKRRVGVDNEKGECE